MTGFGLGIVNATGIVTITNATSSTSKTTGALVVTGGIATSENIISGGNILTRPVPTTADILLIGDSREDSARVPAVDGIRTVLALSGGQLWTKSSLRITHIGGGYDPASDSYYELNALATVSASYTSVIYRLGVNDVSPLSGTDLMWAIAMANAHMNIFCSTATRLSYTHLGSSAVITATQTRGFVQQTTSSYVTVSVTSGTWYVFLAGYRTVDKPAFLLRVSDGSKTRYFTSTVVGMADFATVLRFPIYWYAENTATLTIDYASAAAGVWYLGEAYSLASKSNSSFTLVGETNWNGQVASEDYFEHLRRMHTMIERGPRMSWIDFKRTQAETWVCETDSAGTDLGHYTNPHLLANSVKKTLGMI